MSKCTLREIIKEIPNVQTITLPDDWFEDLKEAKSVFVSLYEWMLEDGKVSSGNENKLSGRTYVGGKLFDRLINAEKKRLKKKLKIKGDDLNRAVFWSDIDAGPKTEIGGCEISGDVILIVPESSKQSLHEFSSKVYKREREATIKKHRVNAAGANFYAWLLSQIKRPDCVGDIARDVVADQGYPRESNQYEEIKSYLHSHGASDKAIESLKGAWLEYLQQYPERIQPWAWCDACGKRLAIADALLAVDAESQEVFVADDACLNKSMRFDEIVSRPLSGVTYDDLEGLVEEDKASEYDINELIESLRLWGVMPITIEGNVYFIMSEKNKEIKIGFTARPVEKRLRSLQTSHPYKLLLLTTIPGSTDDEKSLHERFANIRLEGEWFKPHSDLLTFISVLIKDQSDTTSQYSRSLRSG